MILLKSHFIIIENVLQETSKMIENFSQVTILPLQHKNSSLVIRSKQDKSLLKREMKCQNCKKPMYWTKFSRFGHSFILKCQNKECNGFKGTSTKRNGSFFVKFKISYEKWIHAMYIWTEGNGEKTASRVLDLSSRTLVDDYNFFRKICAKYFELNPIKIGGPGVIVQIN